MNKRLSFLLIILTLTFTAGCIPWQTPQIVFLNTDVSFLSFETLLAKSHFTVKNPNAIALHGRVEYEVFVNGNKFFDGISSPIEMPASGETSFTLDSKIDITKTFGVVSDMIREIAAGKTAVPFEIIGKFKSDILSIPIEAPIKMSGELPLPKLPKLDFQSLSLSSLSVDRTTLKLKLKVKNENGFPIKIEPFPYQLVSEGKELISGNVTDAINIQANETRDVAIDLNVNFSQLSETILKQIKDASLNAEIKSKFQSIQ